MVETDGDQNAWTLEVTLCDTQEEDHVWGGCQGVVFITASPGSLAISLYACQDTYYDSHDIVCPPSSSLETNLCPTKEFEGLCHFETHSKDEV